MAVGLLSTTLYLMWNTLRGHEPVVELFRRAAGRNRLAHAYAFVGTPGIGKFAFARLLTACLICKRYTDAELEACGECSECRQWLAGSHPDVLVVRCPEGKKEIPIAAIAGSDDRRGKEGLNHDLALRPMSARRRVAIIDDAELLNEASANALLKTLEEPPGDSLLILVAGDFAALLPTIRSRCQPVRFAPLADEVLIELLLEQSLVENRVTAETVAALSEGSLAVAAQLLDPGIRGLRNALFDGLAGDTFEPHTLSERLVGGIDELGGDRQRQRLHAGWLVRFAIEFYRRRLRESTGDVDGAEAIGERIDRCGAANVQLDRNSPVPLVIEAWLDDLARRSKVR